MTPEEACNAASLKLCKLKALADLIAAANITNLDDSTLTTIGLHAWELASEAKDLIDENWKPQRAKAGAE